MIKEETKRNGLVDRNNKFMDSELDMMHDQSQEEWALVGEQSRAMPISPSPNEQHFNSNVSVNRTVNNRDEWFSDKVLSLVKAEKDSPVKDQIKCQTPSSIIRSSRGGCNRELDRFEDDIQFSRSDPDKINLSGKIRMPQIDEDKFHQLDAEEFEDA